MEFKERKIQLNDVDELTKEEFITEFNYFCSKLNFGMSPLDCRAIQFMNRFNHFMEKLK